MSPARRPTLTQRITELAEVLAGQAGHLATLTEQVKRLTEYMDDYADAETMGRILGREQVLDELQRQPFVVRRRAQRHQERPASSLSQRPERPWYLRPVDDGTA
jgi:hypothetical protein